MATYPLRPPLSRLSAGKPRCARALSLATVAVLSSARAGAASVPDLYYQRTVMHALGVRCRLFTPEISAALVASALQARGAALRAGAAEEDMIAVADRAEAQAESIGCTAPVLAVAADRVRKAFTGYARLDAMDFPGELSVWRAARNPLAPLVDRRAVGGPRWRLSEAGCWAGSGSGAVLFGLAGDNAAPVVASGAPGSAQASGAFLTVRDPAKAAAPYIDPRRGDLAGRIPPPAVARTFVAVTRAPAPASLLAGGGVLFAFPRGVVRALEALDPREVATVEFIYPDRPSQRAVFEVGDFAAGRAFLLAGR